jgi:hypothetical protein
VEVTPLPDPTLDINPDEFVLPPPEWPEVAGIHLNGCVGTLRTYLPGHAAHAHTSLNDEWTGWICVDHTASLGTTAPITGNPLFGRVLTQPNVVGAHEYAHLQAGPYHGHDAAWLILFHREARRLGIRLLTVHNTRAGDRVRLSLWVKPRNMAGRYATIRRTNPKRASLTIDNYTGRITEWPYELLEPA